MSRYRNYGKTRFDDEEDDGQPTIRDYKQQELRRKEKRLKNALKSKNIDALLEDDDYDDV